MDKLPAVPIDDARRTPVQLADLSGLPEVALYVIRKLSTLDRVNGPRPHGVLKKHTIDVAVLRGNPGVQCLAVMP